MYCLTRDKESASFFAVVLSFFCFFFCFLLLTFPICSVFVFCFVLFIFFLSSWDLFIFCLFSFFVFCLRDGFCFLLFRFLFVLFPVPPDQAICNNEPQSILVTFSLHYYSAWLTSYMRATCAKVSLYHLSKGYAQQIDTPSSVSAPNYSVHVTKQQTPSVQFWN